MVVRLSDIRSGKNEEKKSGVVRLSDMRTERYRAEQQPLKDIGMDYASQYGPKKELVTFPSQPIVKQEPNVTLNDIGMGYADQSRRFKEFDSGIQAKAAELKAIEDAKPTYRERVMERLEKITPLLRPLAAIPASIAEFTEPAQPFIESVYTPGGAPAAVANMTKGAFYGISRALPALSRSRTGRIAKTALTEGLVGAPLGVSNVMARNAEATPEEIAEGALWGA